MSFSLAGAMDVHVHAAPSLFPRRCTADELAKEMRRLEMAGAVLKAHHGSSVEVAHLVQSRNPDLTVRGGIVLNWFVGGINVHAVDSALALGASIVWLPTLSAANHAQAIGGNVGDFPFQHASIVRRGKPLSILDERGQLIPELRDVLDLMDEGPAVLASGHISSAELHALVKYVDENHLRIRLLVNHSRYFTPALTLETIRTLARPHIWFELCFFSTCALAQATSVEAVAAWLKAEPQVQWILASDAGQCANPSPPEALRSYCHAIVEAGASASVVTRSVTQAPRDLLAIPRYSDQPL